jgi:hypothetical protein
VPPISRNRWAQAFAVAWLASGGVADKFGFFSNTIVGKDITLAIGIIWYVISRLRGKYGYTPIPAERAGTAHKETPVGAFAVEAGRYECVG